MKGSSKMKLFIALQLDFVINSNFIPGIMYVVLYININIIVGFTLLIQDKIVISKLSNYSIQTL